MSKAHNAAKLYAAHLTNKGYTAKIWTKDEIKEYGWGSGTADAAVCCEGIDHKAITLWAKEYDKTQNPQDQKNVYIEQCNDFLVYFYDQRKIATSPQTVK